MKTTSVFLSLVAILLIIPTQAFAAVTISDPYNGYFSLSQPAQIPAAYHIDQKQGGLRVTFLGYQRLQSINGLATSSPLTKWGGKFLLNYSACENMYCPNPFYPTMTTELWPGQSTYYLNYKITLDSVSDGAFVTITNI